MSDEVSCCGACGHPLHTTKEADRIEALTKERDDYAFKLADANNTYNEMHVALSEANDKLAKVLELLKEARQDLEEYVTHEWPKDEHPVYERKWERDMELCRRIDATLAEIEGEKT
jgi:chromosome segregation ATPase